MTSLLLLSVVILLVTECYGTKPSGLGAPMHLSSSSSSDPSVGSRMPSDPSLSSGKTSSLSPPNGNSGYSPGGQESDQKTQEGSQPIPGIDVFDETNVNTADTDDSTVQKDSKGHMGHPVCILSSFCRNGANLKSGSKNCNDFCLSFTMATFSSGECKDSKCCCYKG